MVTKASSTFLELLFFLEIHKFIFSAMINSWELSSPEIRFLVIGKSGQAVESIRNSFLLTPINQYNSSASFHRLHLQSSAAKFSGVNSPIRWWILRKRQSFSTFVYSAALSLGVEQNVVTILQHRCLFCSRQMSSTSDLYRASQVVS